MAERAHPDDPGFRRKWQVKWIAGVIPFPERAGNPYRDALFWRYQVIAKQCRGKDLLDVPCGMGWGTSMLTGCHSLIGIDISTETIAEARSRYGHLAEFRVGNMTQLDVPTSTIDIVSCLEGIEHVPPEVAVNFVRECHRVLRPHGLLIMSSPHCMDAPHSGNPYHIKEYQPSEIRQLVEPFFDVVHEVQRKVDNLLITMFSFRRSSR